MTSSEFLTQIESISVEHPQGVPMFIGDYYPEVVKALVDDGKVIKMSFSPSSDSAGTFLVLPQNQSVCEANLNLNKYE